MEKKYNEMQHELVNEVFTKINWIDRTFKTGYRGKINNIRGWTVQNISNTLINNDDLAVEERW